MKKRVLYLTNIEVPYRVKFFNLMAERCDLTVMYERRRSASRDSKWSSSEKKSYSAIYLDGKNIGAEYGFSFKILEILKRGWDAVIVGCYNSKVQIMAMAYMRLKGISFFINLDGEPFIESGLKATAKRCALGGARGYLTAGVKSAESLKKAIGDRRPITPYFFSSLTKSEVEANGNEPCERGRKVLVVGQYQDYKGMDVAFRAACKSPDLNFIFVGMGNRTEAFKSDMDTIPANVSIIPFLQKSDLEKLYRECAVLVLPTRRECWGLVINEAASFGLPVVSTWGSGAAVEFLSPRYSRYLSEPGNPDSLLECLRRCIADDTREYSEFLKETSALYTVERNVEAHIAVLDSI